MQSQKENQPRIKSVDELTFSDNFMFSWIMHHDKEICKGVIERLLKIKVRDIEYPTIEATISPYYESKGVRLDVYVEDSDKVFDIEIQTYETEVLPLRARYYQSMIDADLIMKGEDYSELCESFIVFICVDDPKGDGLPVYTFRNRCDENPKIVMGDKTVKVYANASAYESEEDVELRAFLEYIKNKSASSSFTKNLDSKVDEVKKINKFRSDYGRMNLHDRDIIKMTEKETKRETARNFLKMGLTLEQVSQGTGLSLDEITSLQAEQPA